MKRYLSSILAVLALSAAAASLEMNAQVRRAGSGESRSSSPVSTKSSSVSRSSNRPSSGASRAAMPSGNRNITGRTTSSGRAATLGRSAVQPSASRSVSRSVSRPDSPSGAVSPGGVPVHRNPGVSRRPAPVSAPYRAGAPVSVRRVHPVERAFLPYTYRPVFHGDPGCHYYGYRVRRLPVGYTVYRYNNVVYYCYDGIYYRPYGDYYTVCRPPFGVTVAASATGLALAAVTFAIGSAIANAITNASTAAVVNNGNGTVSPASMPQQNLGQSLGLSQTYRGNNPYYYQDGVFYELINGQYYVIVPPVGAQVESIPDDYETVVLNGQQYYKVDDTVYTVSVSAEGTAVFEVLGQLYR